MINPRDTAKKLIETATDDRTPEKERVNAMVQAVRIIKQHDLLATPLDGLLDSSNETVKAASTIFSSLTNPDFVAGVKQIAKGLGGVRRPAGGGGRARRR